MLPWLQRTQNKTIPYATTKRANDQTYKNATVHMDFLYINDTIIRFYLGKSYLYDKIIHFINYSYCIKPHFYSWYC